MISTKEEFFKYLAQTSTIPMAVEIDKAEGVWLYDNKGKRYLDLISGISVNIIGHRHPEVIKAIHNQLEKYLHVMVYGEFILSPQTKLAQRICSTLPSSLNNVFFVNSGSEAIEGAMKLSKRASERTKTISFKNGYHGSTHGAMSIMGCESAKNSFRPLLPDTDIITFNDTDSLSRIDNKTACVVAETIQGEAGAITPDKSFMKALRERCNETGALLILDEIQCGVGRTGKLWAFEHYGIVPDILTIAKGLGGGLPIGAFVASKDLMHQLTHDPVLGHISTFGGNPLCCAAALATLNVIINEKTYLKAESKEKLFKANLKHHFIKSIKGKGLMLAIEFESFEQNKRIIDRCIQKGIITDWFLFAPHCLRIAPPLIINEEQIIEACNSINEAIEEEEEEKRRKIIN